ncbi:MAG: carboxypeptidase-like regulatory domain-containing protein [Roseivirga sp.]|nr:carboxypeptidase-like regulatory domain-containing protein [Roseivirga sp.]
MNKLIRKLLPVACIIVMMYALSLNSANAQQGDEPQIVQLSGLVMSADSTGIPFVNIYNPRTGRGTASNLKGWFSHPFIAGDEVVFSVIGFKNRAVVIPGDVGEKFTLIMVLEEEVTELAAVEINPFPTEEIFKEAIMAMNLSEQQESVLRNFEPSVVQELIRTMPIEGSADLNYRYMMNQQFQNLQNSAGPRTNPLLNPFAWGQFIKSLKKKKK